MRRLRLRAAAVSGLLMAGVLAAGLTSSAATAPPEDGTGGTVVVASKNFEESRLLAEMFAQLLEARAGLRVERRLNLAGTQVCFEALRTGAVDLYPEYTGTGLVSLLGESPPTEATPAAGSAATLRRVRAEFLRRWDLHWLAPLGFENAYEVAVRRAVADEHGLRTISDLATVSGDLKAAFGYEFSEREDGLPGLERAYGLRFAGVQRMQQTIKYQAAGDGRVDALDVYTTDGRLLTYDLVVLDDDRGFFPPYQAAPLVRGAALAAHPQIGSVLSLLAGALDEETMRGLNLRLQEGGEEPAAVARDELARLGLVGDEDGSADAAPTRHGDGSFFAYLLARRGELGRRTAEHLGLTAAALLLGILTAVPTGLLLERRRRLAEPAIRVVGLSQTVPSLALLAFMIPLLGVGARPAIVALWIYSLFPMLRNTYTGVRDADPDAVAAALALGMTRRQVLLEIRLPLAAPVIMAGIRTAAVITVGTATLAAFIGAGGLGEPIVTGLQLADVRMILSGAVPAALLALAVDGLLAWVEHHLRPAGLES